MGSVYTQALVGVLLCSLLVACGGGGSSSGGGGNGGLITTDPANRGTTGGFGGQGEPSGATYSVTYEYYTVTGSTNEQLMDSMDKNGAGVNMWAWIGWDLDWSKCCPVRTHSNMVIELPRWDPPAGVDPALINTWNRTVEMMRIHELVHRDIRIRMLNDMFRVLTENGPDVDAEVQGIIQRQKREHQEFDNWSGPNSEILPIRL